MAAFKKIEPGQTFAAPPVRFPAPGQAEDDGDVLEIVLRFRWLSREQWRDYWAANKDLIDVDFVLGLVQDWDAAEPYGREALAVLLGYYPRAFARILDGFLNALTGEEEKN